MRVSRATERPYRRVLEIAHGGMGYVELALRREGRFSRLYALKRLHRQFRDDPGFRAMFMDEARLAGLVRHPNVVSVLDIGEDEEGPYLIMEYVEGLSLASIVSIEAASGRRVPLQIAVETAIGVARGLHAAHELRSAEGALLGLVHRDVSPHNIVVGYDGTVRVTDFGIAKAMGNATRTTTGVLKGNMGYMAPEQLRYEELDRRSDLFSLGVVLYELLRGERLYGGGQGAEGAFRILNEPPPDIGEIRPEVPPSLVELLFELLAKDKQNRPATANLVADRLDAVRAELVADTEAYTLPEYMSWRFSDAAAETRTRIRAALQDVERTAIAKETLRIGRRWATPALGVLLAASMGFVLARAAHTSQPSGTAHTAHASQPSDTAHTAHASQPSDTAHTAHASQPSDTAQTAVVPAAPAASSLTLAPAPLAPPPSAVSSARRRLPKRNAPAVGSATPGLQVPITSKWQ